MIKILHYAGPNPITLLRLHHWERREKVIILWKQSRNERVGLLLFTFLINIVLI